MRKQQLEVTLGNIKDRLLHMEQAKLTVDKLYVDFAHRDSLAQGRGGLGDTLAKGHR